MKMALLLRSLLALQTSAFAGEPRKRHIQTVRQAVAVVRRYIRANGGDPSREEITATRGRMAWRVTSWHILDPDTVGSSRFAPGGFTDYTVSMDGRIVETMGGL